MIALLLALVAMDGGRAELAAQLHAELVAHALGGAEDDDAAAGRLGAQDLAQPRHLAVAVHDLHKLRDGLRRSRTWFGAYTNTRLHWTACFALSAGFVLYRVADRMLALLLSSPLGFNLLPNVNLPVQIGEK